MPRPKWPISQNIGLHLVWLLAQLKNRSFDLIKAQVARLYVGYYVAVWDLGDSRQSIWLNVYIMLREQDMGMGG
jgi:hypothetical protein